MLLPSLTACLLLLSSSATALRHGEQDNAVVQAQWEAPHVAAHHQRRDGFIIADGKRISRRTHAKLHARQPPPPPPPGPPAPPPPGKAPGGSWKDKPTAPSHVKIKVGELWRGETFRKPEDVRKAGGFESHAKRIFEGTHPDYPKGMTQDAFKLGSSVYHHSKKTCSCSSYVSMSASKDEATNFASKQTAERTYVYKIRPETSKVVDVAGSLGGDRHLTWTKEKEIAGVYEVPWKQVIGWHEGTPTKAEGGGSEIVFSEFINKGDVYPDDPLPEEVPLSGEFEIRSELAGFPEGHLGRTELPWKKFNDVPVEGWLNEYMLDRIFNKDKAEFTKARKAAEWANLPCSSLKRKRAGAPAGCDQVDITESEVEDNVSGPEGEDSPAEPGKEVVNPPTEGEEPPPEPAGSEPEEGAVSPESPELVAQAEKFSEEEYISFATTKRMVKSVTETLSLSIKDIRTKALGYKPLNPKSPSFKIRPGKVAVGGANVALGVVTVGAWIKGMVDAFEHDVNLLDKTAAVTSIVPFVGCTTNLAAQAWKGNVDHQDTALCYVGDGLLMTPLAPLGIAVHIIRWFISLGKPPAVPEKEVFVQHRDSQWEKFLADHVYTYIYSDSKEPSNSKEKSFRAKLSSTLNIRGLAVVSEGAQKIGAAKAVAQKSLKASKDESEKAEIEKGSVEVVEGIRAGIWNDTLRSQRDYLLELPDALRDQSKASLKPLGEAFNDDYVKNVTSIQMARIFYQPDRSNKFPAYPGEKPGNLGPVQAKLRIIAAHVKNAPLPLPKTFSLAYILGQSKGLEGLDAGVLSPRDYLRDQKAPKKLSEDRINFFSLFHTLEVTKLLQGYIKEGELRNPWKSDIEDARPLHLLIAMKFGKIFEERKGSAASGPDIPPLLGRDGSLESTPSLAAITGLSEEIVRNLPKEGDFLRYKDLISEKMLMAMLRLAQSWSAPSDNKEQAADKSEI